MIQTARFMPIYSGRKKFPVHPIKCVSFVQSHMVIDNGHESANL